MQPSHLVSVVVGIAVLGLLEPGSVRSQIPLQVVEDGTLGTQVTVRGRTFVIDNGTTVGNNLFHSFQQFSVPAGGRASFQNALSIRNILVRVTGGMRSEIQGTIQTRGSANLFLMNPSGILFGENAQLQIGGSFVGTTASAILFPNGAQFSLNSSVAPENELLRVNPSALLVNQLSGQTPGIQTAGSYLSVPTGQSLLLIGGNVQFGSGSAFNSELVARGGRLEIAALSDGLVGVEMDGANRPRLNISHPVAGAAVRINEGTVFNIGGSSTNSAYRSGGYLQIYGASITANGSNNSPIALNARGAEQGRGGIVSLHATENLALRNTGINVDSNQMGEGAGSIAIAAGNAVLLSGGGTSLSSQTYGSGVGGNIAIRGRTIRLTDQASILTNTFGSGDAGTVSFRADGTIHLEGASGLSTVSVLGATGKGGAVDIRSGSLRLTDQSFISTSTASAGAAGNVDIHTGTFELTGGSRIVTTTSGEGDAGRVRIDTGPQGRVSILDSRLVSSTGDGSGGRGGDIQLETGNLFLTDGVLSASTAGTQRAGNIHIRASHSVQVTGLAPNFSGAVAGFLAPGIFTSTIAPGPAGILSIHTGQLSVQGGARISSSTASPFTTGTGGIVSVHADSVELAGIARDGRSPSGLFTETQAAGDAGSLTINAPRLLIRDGAQASASTSGTGRPGSILVQNGDSVSLTSGTISTAINPGAIVRAGEPAGNITIQTRTLSLNNHARISASTSGEGDAGNIRIQATDATSLTNSGISTAVNPGAIGRGGNIDIQTGVFSLADNAQVTASTAGQGNAGSVRVTATTFESSGGGQIRTSTAGGSNAGSINLYVLDSVTLTGNRSGLFASTDRGSSGNGGSIFIDPRIVTVRDGARIAVDSQGSGTGGSIDLQAGRLVLDRGEISAQTASNQGGNINLQLSDLLLLRRNSQISTTAGTAQAGGDGGNIRITAPFIMALRTANNDITANAFTGRGGRVDITTQGLFGIEPRDRLTPLSDITASSEFGIAGVVTINTPDVDPSRGLTELPSNLVDAASQIAQGCVPDTRQSTSSFVVTGRGGLPPSPTEPLGNDAVMTAWVTVDGKQEVGNRGQVTGDRGQGIEDRGQRTEDKGQRRQRRTGNRGQGSGAGTPDTRYPVPNPPSSSSTIIEAQSWIVDANGQIVLVAPSSTPNSHSWLVNGACRTAPGD